MLKIKDTEGKTKYILSDDDEEPVPVSEIALVDVSIVTPEEKQEPENA